MAGLTAGASPQARMLRQLRQEGVADARVLEAMTTLSRAAFLDDSALAPLAFEDAGLPIGCGQVMLRPVVTGHLLQALDLSPDASDRILLVGFGAGYMTALLAGLCQHVFAVDRYATLVRRGEARLAGLGFGNVTLRQADGLAGWPEAEPFDRIVLAGAVLRVPPALRAQLTERGRLAAPLAGDAGCQIVSVTPDGAETVTAFAAEVPGLRRGIAAAL